MLALCSLLLPLQGTVLWHCWCASWSLTVGWFISASSSFKEHAHHGHGGPLATEVPLLSYEDPRHFTGFVSTTPCASGCESQPPCSVHLPSGRYSNVHTHCWTLPPPPVLNILSPWALPYLSKTSLFSWHSISYFEETSFKALSCPAFLGWWVTAAQCWKA